MSVKKSAFLIVVLIGSLFVWMGFNAMAATWINPPFENPSAPLPEINSSTFASFDLQTHSRDVQNIGWDAPFAAEHGSTCEAPPATHLVQSFTSSVFVCNNHVMTSANAAGYGEIVLTPNQIVNCSSGCTVQWSISTERMSLRDWPDVWLTPWADNLTLPFDQGDVDLQGVPRQGIHVSAASGQNAWQVYQVANYAETQLLPNAWWQSMSDGITPGTNQGAVRQTFRLTVLPGAVKMERLASATASSFVWTLDTNGNPGFTPCTCLLAADYVVQFAHHSYNPTKDGAGIPGTWHWSDFSLNNVTPFNIIKTPTKLLQYPGGSITFNTPAPANSWLRFSGTCSVLINGSPTAAPKQTYNGHPEHASSYFIPMPQGMQTVSFSFAPDTWFFGGPSNPCYVEDSSIWSLSGAPLPTPTPAATATVSVPTPTATAIILPTPTAVLSTPTSTVIPPTSTPTPIFLPTATPDTGPTRLCTLRWGNNTIESYGQLTQAQCAARGN